MRRLGLFTLGGSSAVLIGVVVFALWLFGSSAVSREPFSTLDLVPQDVDFYLAVNTEPASSQWIAFANSLDRMNVDDPIRDAWDELLSEQDLSWEKDIISLLGNEGYIAVTDFSLLEENRGVVAAFELRDGSKAQDLFLRLAPELKDEDGSDLLEEAYEGETIYYFEEEYYGGGLLDFDDDFAFDPIDSQPEMRDAGAMAFVDGIAVAGMARQDVQGVIDVIQGSAPSAAANERFQELRTRQEDDFLLWGYADLAALWAFLDEYLAENEEDFDVDQFLDEARDNADRASFTVSAIGDGFVIDASLLRAPDAPAGPDYPLNTVFESHYAEQVPEDTLGFFAGYDLYNEIYRPTHDALADIDLTITDPYCFGFAGYAPLPYSEEGLDDPVYGQFYDENGNLDYEAYEEWEAELERRFTRADGSFDYDGYFAHIDGLYADYCEENAQTFTEVIEEFEQDVGFDLENDLLQFITGEFAVALNVTNLESDEPDFDVLGMLAVTNASRVAESMTLLDRYLEREEGWTAEAGEDGIHRLSEHAGSDDVVAWGVTDDSLAVSYPDAPAQAFVGGLDGKALADSEDWRRVMELLPEQKTFIGYVSLARLLEELRELGDLESEFDDFTSGEVTLDDLGAIRSLGIAGTPIEGGWGLRIAVLIRD